MTDAERKLWSILRGRQIEGLKFRRQHPFKNYILDFVCLEEKIIIEVDGGINLETARLAKKAGADIIVSASYIFKSSKPQKIYEELSKI